MSAPIAIEYKRRYFMAMNKSAIQRAVQIAGSQEALAAQIGVTQGLVSQWCNGASIKPLHFAAIEQATKVTANELLVDEMTKASARRAATSSTA